MRLFASVRPPAAVLDHLDRALDGVGVPRSVLPGRGRETAVRWVPRDDRHLTTAFYADVPEGAVPELLDDLAAVAAGTEPFELRLRGAGSFQGRVLWMGVDGAAEDLVRLAQGCLDASVREVPDDVRPHRPHLSVARARPARGRRGASRAAQASAFDAPARALAVYEGPAWTVDTLELLESLPGEGPHGGPLYRVVATWPLGAPSHGAH
ncbi:RNA 2',3'-cyclic phosphodiesterase [Luteimicrobium subarcticum]|uniref:RNA 2',3'-cyclic phosphodiesterase n=1 Tax=Luteimicrobium subarcticum TaxID=620910 RepID=A0A2M8WTT8_9MICO|nr:RNA 2',3'-cyclic phosphodiesterase [Luteimicrobium subarcticum]PJI94304.1 2'-5' RNA ligase [Luteimicrobium subarcticum]